MINNINDLKLSLYRIVLEAQDGELGFWDFMKATKDAWKYAEREEELIKAEKEAMENFSWAEYYKENIT